MSRSPGADPDPPRHQFSHATPLHKVTLSPPDDEKDFEVRGYRFTPLRTVLAHFVSAVLFLGLPYLVGRWRPNWKIRWFGHKCTLDRAEVVLVTDDEDNAVLVPVESVDVPDNFPARFRSSLSSPNAQHSASAAFCIDSDEERDALIPETSTVNGGAGGAQHRFFHHKHLKYAWDNAAVSFTPVRGLDHDQTVGSFHLMSEGFTAEEQAVKQILHGPNRIEVEVKSIVSLLLEEVLHPFYIFQTASMILWYLDEYVYYASCILLISLVSIFVALYETRRQSRALQQMVTSATDLTVSVMRGPDVFVEVPSADIVPGDVIDMPAGGTTTLTCDAVLLTGACIVNEAMLTGESVPVTKSPLQPSEEDDELYDPERHSRHTLFAGTSVIQTRTQGSDRVLAVVVRTGFMTAKGELIRSILFPKPMDFKFYKDSMRFIGVLAAIATVGMAYCMYVYISRGSDVRMIILRCLDIITIVVPPALPAAMTVGTVYAQHRLKKKMIFCISPQKINVCGKLKLVCFDKTGTLTEDGLDLWGVVPAEERQFGQLIRQVAEIPDETNLKACLASCHSLTTINDELTGDPLDVKMFEATRWDLDETDEDAEVFDMPVSSVIKARDVNPFGDEERKILGIVRQFTFSSAAARMSVIAKNPARSRFEIFVKGAPERLEPLCRPETMPEDFHDQLKNYTLQGFRVIALAHRNLPAELTWDKTKKAQRETVERDLAFLGFLIMKNTLKPETTPVIKELKEASVRCVMVTGDNLLTAMSVARDCRMIEHRDRVILVDALLPDDDTSSRRSSQGGYQSEDFKVTYTETEKPDRRDGPIFEEVNPDYVRGAIAGGDAERGTVPRGYHFAMTGRTWGIIRTHFPHLLPKLIVKGTIFARMAPDQKAKLVEELQELDYVVAMCGDGANDCGALKAAHVGISLSEAEASVAAPFTSKVANISCVPSVIREGRCALVTSFSVFKYMALYSMIQFITVLTLYTLRTNLGDSQFLYIDLVITTVVAVFMSWTGASERIVAKRPSGSLVSGTNLFSILSQIVVVFAAQIGALLFLRSQPWYVPNDPDDPEAEVIVCWETTTLFYVSAFQYLILAAAFSKGQPYRKRFITNVPFTVALVALSAFTLVLVLGPGATLANFFELVSGGGKGGHGGHFRFRLALVGIILMNACLSFAIENWAIDSRWLKRFTHWVAKKKGPKNRFRVLEAEMSREQWPPVQSRSRFNPGVS